MKVVVVEVAVIHSGFDSGRRCKGISFMLYLFFFFFVMCVKHVDLSVKGPFSIAS